VPAKAGTHPEMPPHRTIGGWTPAFAGVAIENWAAPAQKTKRPLPPRPDRHVLEPRRNAPGIDLGGRPQPMDLERIFRDDRLDLRPCPGLEDPEPAHGLPLRVEPAR